MTMNKTKVALIFGLVLLLSLSLFLYSNVRKEREILLSAEVSADGAVLSLPDNSFSVTIPRNAFSTPQRVEIARPSEIPKSKIGKVLSSYEIMSTVEFFDKPVVIEFNVSEIEKKSKSDKKLEDKYIVACYDENNKVYVEVPFEVNSAENKIVVRTEHFSLWALIGVEDYVVATSPHFKIRFYESSQAAGLGARDIFEYVAKVREFLEEAYDIYVKAGFTPPKSKASVYVIDAEESHYTPFTGNIIISTKSPSDKETKHEIAHELFHLFQNQDVNILRMSAQRWWIEATADYAADRIAFKTGEMGSGIKMNYYKLPLSTVDGNHEYATALFVDYLAGRGIPMISLWRAVKESWAVTDVESALDGYLRKHHRTSLLAEYSHFIDFLLFNENSPIKTPGKGYPSGMVCSLIHFPTQEDTESKILSLNPYSSKVVGITCDMPKDQKTRNIVITATDGIYSHVSARVYLLENNERGKEKLVGTIVNVDRPLTVKMSEKDAIYIVISSEKLSEIGLKITAKTIKYLSVPFSFSENYYIGKNILQLSISGSFYGPIEDSRISRSYSYFGDSLSATVFVNSASVPTEIIFTPKYKFSLGTKWREETSTGYVSYTVGGIRYGVTYYEIGPDCRVLPAKETSFITSWTYYTVTVDTSKCQGENFFGGGLYQILSARISMHWDYSYEVVEVRGGVERIVETGSGTDGRLIAEITVTSVS